MDGAMTTIRELSDELGVSAQTIRRFVRTELRVATKPRQKIVLDANQASAVADHFKNSNSGYVKSDMNIATAENVELLQEVATLRERVAGYEREIQRLEEQVEILRGQLDREQRRGFFSRLWPRRALGPGKED